MKQTFFLLIIIITFASCEDYKLENGEMPLGFNPPEFGEPVYDYTQNSLTKDGFELGRALFYDPILSLDSTISCASCHQQAVAFAHADHDVSHGFEGRTGIRNAPAIFNNRWYPNFFWDGGGNHIELVPLNAITNEVEMNQPLPELLLKLNAHKQYSKSFKKVFNIDAISSKYLFYALAQFTGSLISENSKYDQVERNETAFTEAEERGYSLFIEHCSDCHTEPLFTNNEYINNGLTVNRSGDEGRKNITNRVDDLGKFRVPSLRNIAKTKPYMHDGRFQTLDNVIEYYRTGIHNSPTLSPTLVNGISISDSEKADLLAFLNTLTDETLLHDLRFASPF
jgi:cytochrome c peroxidase